MARQYLEETTRLIEQMSENTTKQKIDEKLDRIFNREKINEKTIKFTNEFKEEFLRLYKQGVNPVSIFRELGINPKIIGQVRIDKFTYRIKAQASRPEGFSRKENSSKGKRRKLSFKSKDEELEYYKELSEKLAQENEFLKKLKALKNTK